MLIEKTTRTLNHFATSQIHDASNPNTLNKASEIATSQDPVFSADWSAGSLDKVIRPHQSPMLAKCTMKQRSEAVEKLSENAASEDQMLR